MTRKSLAPTRIALAVGLLLASLSAVEAQGGFCQFTGQPGPCRPADQYGVGEDLRVTFLFAPGGRVTARPRAAAPIPSAGRLDTIRDLLGALRVCFVRADLPATSHDISATIRFAFNRDGTLLGRPRLTYVTARASAQMRRTIMGEMDRAVGGCTPLPFTDGLGGAIAGRPLTVRIVIQASSRRS